MSTTTELVVGDGRRLALALGDITALAADAIVNAANERLIGGGGVDGAIHRVGGPSVMADLVTRYGRDRRCPTGSAVVSTAGRLPARWVIHAVGPVWRGGSVGEAELLASACSTSIGLADRLGARHVTVPAISTGAYGYPLSLAAGVCVRAFGEALAAARGVERVTVVLRSDEAFAAFADALGGLVGQAGNAGPTAGA